MLMYILQLQYKQKNDKDTDNNYMYLKNRYFLDNYFIYIYSTQ